MTITLKLKSGLEKLLDRNVLELEIKGTECLLDILRQINFPEEKAGVVLINGKLCSKDYRLHGGETVKIFPQTIGC